MYVPVSGSMTSILNEVDSFHISVQTPALQRAPG